MSDTAPRSRRGSGDGMFARRPTQHGKPQRWRRVTANETPARDRLGRGGVTERPVRAKRPRNAGGAKGPQFKDNAASDTGPGDWR